MDIGQGQDEEESSLREPEDEEDEIKEDKEEEEKCQVQVEEEGKELLQALGFAQYTNPAH